MNIHLQSNNQNNLTLRRINQSGDYTQFCDFCSRSKAIAEIDLNSNYGGGNKKLCKYCLRVLQAACRSIIKSSEENG